MLQVKSTESKTFSCKQGLNKLEWELSQVGWGVRVSHGPKQATSWKGGNNWWVHKVRSSLKLSSKGAEMGPLISLPGQCRRVGSPLTRSQGVLSAGEVYCCAHKQWQWTGNWKEILGPAGHLLWELICETFPDYKFWLIPTPSPQHFKQEI